MRIWLLSLIGLVLAVLILWVGPLIVSTIIEGKIQAFDKVGIYEIDFESLDVNLFTRSISIEGVSVKDSTKSTHLVAPEIKLRSIRILPALFKDKYFVKQVLVSNPKINCFLPEEKPQETNKAKPRDVLPGGLYRLEANQLLYDSEDSEVRLDSFSLKSEFAKYEIAHQTGVQTDWFDINSKTVTLKNLNLNAALNDTAFIASGLWMNDFTMTVFRDKRLPFPDKPDTKLPAEMIDNLPFGLHIDSLLMQNANIRYEEHWENNDQPGAVTFNNLEAKINDISNSPDLIRGETIIKVACNVLNDAPFKVQFTFPNKKYPVAYRTEGRLGPMPMDPFNSLFRSSASTDINSGTIKELKFGFTYNNEHSAGNMNFEYENLKVSLFDAEDGDTKKIKSFLLNTFVVRDQNPDKNGNLKQGKISFDRDKDKSIFNYWWKSVLSGIKDIVAGV